VILGIHGYIPALGAPAEYIFYAADDTYARDDISMTATFNPGEVDSTASYTLHMLAYDQVNLFIGADQYDTTDMQVVFEVNDTEVGRYEMRDPDGLVKFMQELSFEVTGLTPHADNTLHIWLDPMGTNENKYGDKFIYLWDWTLTGPSGDTPLELSNQSFHVSRDPGRTFPTTEKFVASDTIPWNIAHIVDGTSFKYSSQDAVLAREMSAHARFAAATCAPFLEGGQPCFEVFWGNDQWKEQTQLDPALYSQLMELAQDHTGGIVFWRFENNIGRPQMGMLSERGLPASPSGYDLATYWVSNAPASPALFHRWTFTAPTSGAYTLDWWFDRGDYRVINTSTGLYENGPYSFERRVRVQDTLVEAAELEVQPFGVAGVTPMAPSSGTTTFAVTAGDQVELEVGLIRGFGSRWIKALFRLSDGAGAPVPRQDMTFDATVGL
jgi:hypothetical protein